MLKYQCVLYKNYKNYMLKYECVLYKIYDNLKYNVTWRMKLFNDNGILRFNDELIPAIGEALGTLLELLSIWLKNKSDKKDIDTDTAYFDKVDSEPSPDSGENEPGPGPGPGGNESEPDNDDSNKKVNKGKGRAITPEEESKERLEFYTDYDEIHEKDIEEAKLKSLKSDKIGESSKQGATLQQREEEQARLDSLRGHRGESPTEGESLGQNKPTEKEKEIVLSYGHYMDVTGSRRATIRNFNDITMKLNSKHGNMDPEQRQFLLEESLQLKKDVENYNAYIDYLKKLLDIPSDDQGYNSNSSSEESTSEYSSSSDEEARPNKRPKN